MREFETILYEENDGVATVTLNRPEFHNAFNARMQEELDELWSALRDGDDIRCVVLTGAGDRAFCTGIDRSEIDVAATSGFDPLKYRDPGLRLGPRSHGVWKPVIGAVNGMACGGAFYLLGEVDFIIASEQASFFDPHLTYGMTSVYEPILMLPRMPFGELMRMTLMAGAERISAQRAHQIGLVSEVVAAERLMESALEAARTIAGWPPRAVQSTVRTLWAARELSVRQALELGGEFLNLGTGMDDLRAGQEAFSEGRRTEHRTR
ncbi:MAG: enoyl-CoA hydratase/isomerase family protein [Actinobacteria bacterium]|nr:enoyl-CoA hydratase/isomerase family protein [Actinomycetota bacterium]